MTEDAYPFKQKFEIVDPHGFAAPLTGGLVRDSFHDRTETTTRLIDLQPPTEDTAENGGSNE